MAAETVRLEGQLWNAEIRWGGAVRDEFVGDGRIRAGYTLSSSEVWSNPHGLVPYAALVGEVRRTSGGRVEVVADSPHPVLLSGHVAQTRLMSGLVEEFRIPTQEELDKQHAFEGRAWGAYDEINSNAVAFRLAACFLVLSFLGPSQRQAAADLLDTADRSGVEFAVREFWRGSGRRRPPT